MRTGFLLAFVVAAASISCNRNPDEIKRKYLRTGDKYFAIGKYRQASIMYRSAIRQDARFGEGYYRWALAELKEGRLDQAVKPLRVAVELLPPGPDSCDAKSKLANIYLTYLEGLAKDKSVRAEADRLVSDLIHSGPGVYDGHRLKARLAMLDVGDAARRGIPDQVKENLKLAIREFRQADALRPFQTDIVVPLSRSLISDNQLPAAEKLYLALLDHDKSFVPVYGELYNLYLRQRRVNDAEAILRQGMANNPKELLFIGNLAAHYHSVGRNDEALKMIERLKAVGRGAKHVQQTLGSLYVKLGNPDEAIQQYEEGIRVEPNEKNYYRKRIAEILIAGRKSSEASRIIDSVLKDDPKDGEARLLQGSNFLEAGDLSRAVTELRAAVQSDLSNPVPRYLLGIALTEQGQHALALPELQKAMQLDFTYLAARLKFGQVQILLGQYEGAIKTTQNIFEDLSPGNVAAKLLRAVALRNLGRLDEARAEIQAVLKQQPRSTDALLQLGELHLSEKRSREAEQAFRKSYEQNPADTRGLLRIAEMHIGKGETGRALQVLTAESKKYPRRLDLRRAVADISARIQSYGSAIAEYKAILKEAAPESKLAAEVQGALGEAYRASGQYDLAVTALQQARQQLPEDSAVLSNLALTLLHLGRPADAKQLYESTFSLQSDNPIALNNLAYLIAEKNGDLDTALTFAQRARQKWPGVHEISDTLAWIYLKKNLTDNAIEILADLVKKRPGEATFRYHLGAAWLQKGDKVKARKELEVALVNRPSQEETAKIKELLVKAST